MLESSAIDNKILHSYNYLESTHSFMQNQQSKEVTFRQRLHSLLSQNFQLKENITRLQGELKASESERRELKEHLRIVLQQMTTNDRLIETLKNNQIQYHNTIKHHLQDIATYKKELEYGKSIIANLLQHNNNLEAENHLIIEIKQKYASDLTKVRVDFEEIKISNQRLMKQNQCLSIEVEKLLEQISNMEAQIQTRRNDIQQYQKFVLEKLSSVKDAQEFHEQCRDKLEALHCKYAKYKHKASNYKRERDQLLFHLQHVSREIDSDTLRKYYDQVQ